MKYIQVTNEFYTIPNASGQDPKTGKLTPIRPELYDCNLKEWIIHNIMKKHFTFGQPYCVVCGKCKLINNIK